MKQIFVYVIVNVQSHAVQIVDVVSHEDMDTALELADIALDFFFRTQPDKAFAIKEATVS